MLLMGTKCRRVHKEKTSWQGGTLPVEITPDLCNDTIMNKTTMLDSQATSAAIYKQLFTDSEWDAISSAMKDYADYGDEEANIADSIDAKISAIYNLTK